jgi:VanZ family protein
VKGEIDWMNGTKTKRFVLWAMAIGWMAVIFGLSSLHGSSVPSRFSTLAHFGVYAVLGALYVFALRAPERRWPAAILAVILASLYGVTDEFHQSFVPGRVPDPVDWLVDTAGALTGVVIVEAFRRALGRHRAQTPSDG